MGGNLNWRQPGKPKYSKRTIPANRTLLVCQQQLICLKKVNIFHSNPFRFNGQALFHNKKYVHGKTKRKTCFLPSETYDMICTMYTYLNLCIYDMHPNN